MNKEENCNSNNFKNHEVYKYLKFTKGKIEGLVGSKFYDCEFKDRFYFSYTPLEKENKGLEFHNCNFNNIKFSCDGLPKFQDCVFINCNFSNCELSGLFRGCAFSKYTKFNNCVFITFVFINCDLKSIIFRNNYLKKDGRSYDAPTMSFFGCDIDYLSARDNKVDGVLSVGNMEEADMNDILIQFCKAKLEKWDD